MDRARRVDTREAIARQRLQTFSWVRRRHALSDSDPSPHLPPSYRWPRPLPPPPALAPPPAPPSPGPIRLHPPDGYS